VLARVWDSQKEVMFRRELILLGPVVRAFVIAFVFPVFSVVVVIVVVVVIGVVACLKLGDPAVQEGFDFGMKLREDARASVTGLPLHA
jgi:hypothetical protein